MHGINVRASTSLILDTTPEMGILLSKIVIA